MHNVQRHIIRTLSVEMDEHSQNTLDTKLRNSEVEIYFNATKRATQNEIEGKKSLTDVDYQVCWHIEYVLRRGLFMLLRKSTARFWIKFKYFKRITQ